MYIFLYIDYNMSKPFCLKKWL